MENNKIIIANWKMNPVSSKEAESLFSSLKKEIKNIKDIETVICPPFIYLANFLKSKTKNLKLGSQNCFWENQGAYTGEISPLMLKNLGVEYIIIGHSEQRNYSGETDEMIAKKIKAVIENGLTPVLCVGETLEQKKNELAKKIIEKQLEQGLFLISDSKIIVAYEPVWAIGTGNDCQPEEASEMIRFIKYLLNSKFHILNSRVIYGGSVDSKDIADYLKYPEIEGALVGGASLGIEEFKKIINEASKSIKTKSASK
ncbi:MAG: triose-phosphate isomerase [Patescibacteria group bacterium]